ncbi:Hypothetical predicted protein [Paramuricea clavata]|uniref:Uncharacterized protein n=1 Tax=Paramuricea clavata TaxID=317549 RepID=A0A6S7HHR5_PARCT|nr:Hypothetical predicted protein [Paramuricea clavata]
MDKETMNEMNSQPVLMTARNFATSLYWFIKHLQATAIELYDKETNVYKPIKFFSLKRLVRLGNYNSMDGENDSVLKRKRCAVIVMLFVVKDGPKFRYFAVLVYKTFTSNSN